MSTASDDDTAERPVSTFRPGDRVRRTTNGTHAVPTPVPAISVAEHERLMAEKDARIAELLVEGCGLTADDYVQLGVHGERERCAAIVRDEMLRKSTLSVFASLGEVLRCIEDGDR